LLIEGETVADSAKAGEEMVGIADAFGTRGQQNCRGSD
jgi:hypothetical protein